MCVCVCVCVCACMKCSPITAIFLVNRHAALSTGKKTELQSESVTAIHTQ